MELSKDEIRVRKEITDIYDQLVINCRNVCGAGYDKWGPDLLSMSVEMFLEKPIKYQLKVITDGKLENFITHVMNFQLKLGTTRFYHHYRKQPEKSRELYENHSYDGEMIGYNLAFKDEKSELVQCMNQAIEKLNPFQKAVAKEHIIQGISYKDLSDKYDIPYYTFKKEHKRIIKIIKSKCMHLRSAL